MIKDVFFGLMLGILMQLGTLIKQKDKEFVNGLNCYGIEFPASKEDFSKIETKSDICINAFSYKLTFLV